MIMRARFTPLALLVALLLFPNAIFASPFYIGTSPLVPPTDGVYLSPQNVHAEYDAPGLQIILQDIQHSGFTNINRIPVSGGTLETFNSTVVGNVSINGGPLMPISLFGPVQVFLSGYTTGDVGGPFNTEMLSLTLQSASGILLQESPTQSSTGQTKITDLGSGLFHIDSFFDVFTELSIDGGTTFISSQGSTHVDLTNAPLPGALPLFVTGLGALGLLGWRKKKKAAPLAA
jgi:hypothetical protein